MRRHYFNYLHFHTLAMTPTSITITDTTVRILVSRLPRSLIDFSLAYILAARWAQACKDVVDFRPSQKQIS